MQVPGLSDNGLKGIHKGVRRALDEDDNTPLGQDKPYGAREYRDFRDLGDELEEELEKRDIPFEPIPW